MAEKPNINLELAEPTLVRIAAELEQNLNSQLVPEQSKLALKIAYAQIVSAYTVVRQYNESKMPLIMKDTKS